MYGQKKYVNFACDSWHGNNPGKTMTIYDIPGIVATALPQATTEENKTADFALAGISNKNPTSFPVQNFFPDIRWTVLKPYLTDFRVIRRL
ncbi:hypothetical protein AVEN_136238-1 [Araneus ventricosus]|uniref:Uncharacterized protein n=1 Tax=Araneus ventricosus TaxID=182803 RepID=A0A4Y2QK43_ARAVE|nr:hypothetical protein AVEN_171809-1 [Araneus ventricosus]GBN63681.1 hypothetical protein AVEN_136238-1 [Araneus ventricosus]